MLKTWGPASFPNFSSTSLKSLARLQGFSDGSWSLSLNQAASPSKAVVFIPKVARARALAVSSGFGTFRGEK